MSLKNLQKQLNSFTKNLKELSNATKMKVAALIGAGIITLSCASASANAPAPNLDNSNNTPTDNTKVVEVLKNGVENTRSILSRVTYKDPVVKTELDACKEVAVEEKTHTIDKKTIEQLDGVIGSVENIVNKAENGGLTGQILAETTIKVEEVLGDIVAKEAESTKEETQAVEETQDIEEKATFSNPLMAGITNDMNSTDKANRIMTNLNKLNIYISSGTIKDYSETFASLELLEVDVKSGLVSGEDAKNLCDLINETKLNVVESDTHKEFSDVDNSGYVKIIHEGNYSSNGVHHKSNITHYTNSSTGESYYKESQTWGNYISGENKTETLRAITEQGGITTYDGTEVRNENNFDETSSYLNSAKNPASSCIEDLIDDVRCAESSSVTKDPTGNYIISCTSKLGTYAYEIDQETTSITIEYKDEYGSETRKISFQESDKGSFDKGLAEAMAIFENSQGGLTQ